MGQYENSFYKFAANTAYYDNLYIDLLSVIILGL